MTSEYAGDAGAHTVLSVRLTEPAPRAPERRYGTYRTVILQDTNGHELLVPSQYRTMAFVLPLDDDIYIANKASDAERKAGTLVPKGISVPWPIDDQGKVYVAAPVLGGPQSRVSLSAYYCAPPD